MIINLNKSVMKKVNLVRMFFSVAIAMLVASKCICTELLVVLIMLFMIH